MLIRPELERDYEQIRQLIKQAFVSNAHSSQTESQIVDALRAANALTIALVAVEDEDVIGHVAFSPVTINGVAGNWYGLGPVAVRPDRQGQAIGSRLIQAGLTGLKQLGADGCVVLGSPDYYPRFGFVRDRELTYSAAPAPYFMALAFAGNAAKGEVAYHPGFDAR